MYIILSQEKARQVIRIIREHPGITKQELAGKLRISPSSCNWYLRRFRDDGVIMIIFDGVHNHYRLTCEAEAAYKTILTDQTKRSSPIKWKPKTTTSLYHDTEIPLTRGMDNRATYESVQWLSY